MKKPNITIRRGASKSLVIIDGVTFDCNAMKPEAVSKLRRVVRDVFQKLADEGSWGKRQTTPAQRTLQEAGRNAPAYRRSSRQRSNATVAA